MLTSRGHSDFLRVGTQLPLRFGSACMVLMGVVLNKTWAADILIVLLEELLALIVRKLDNLSHELRI